MHGGYWNGPFPNGFQMSSWSFVIPIILILLIAVAVYMIYKNNKGSVDQSSFNNALDILDERYAKGEIDEEEYKKKKKNLMDNQ